MRRYEVVFVLAPTLAEEEVESQIETYSSVAKELGAEIVETDRWGKRRFAFPVKNHTEGFYTVLTMDIDSDAPIVELERRFKVSDAVIRFLTVRVDQELKRAEKFDRKREARKKRRKLQSSPRSRVTRKPTGSRSEAESKEQGDGEA
jgi:small subunit ribosomal protein S6